MKPAFGSIQNTATGYVQLAKKARKRMAGIIIFYIVILALLIVFIALMQIKTALIMLSVFLCINCITNEMHITSCWYMDELNKLNIKIVDDMRNILSVAELKQSEQEKKSNGVH